MIRRSPITAKRWADGQLPGELAAVCGAAAKKHEGPGVRTPGPSALLLK
ncbi:hypothetical protein AB0M48_33530 [Lentzea sp. NPDC051208]